MGKDKVGLNRIKDRTTAVLTIHRPGEMTKRGRSSIVKWLLRQADLLEKEAHNMSGRYTARYLYR